MSETPATKRHPVHALRIGVQLAVLALFLVLVGMTARGTFVAAHPWLAHLFLITDPLVLVGATLAGAFSGVLLASLAVVGLSLVAPRAYCGWICPLGTMQDIVDRLLFRHLDRSGRAWPRLRKVKVASLVFVLVAAAFGLGVFGWVNPNAIALRSAGVALYPIGDHAARSTLVAGETQGLESAGRVYDWARANHLLAQDADLKEGTRWIGHPQAWIFLGLLLGILLAQALQRRFWCRNLCPLGGMLGLLGAASPLRPGVSEACIRCDRCRRGCKTGAFEPAGDRSPYRNVPSECILCWACEREFCPVGAIRVGIGDPAPRHSAAALPGRRALLGTAAIGALAAPAMLLDWRTREKEESNPKLRPPGARRPDDEFLAACIRCGACMKVCPTGALHPDDLANGIASLWTPTFVFNIGYCDWFCGVGRGEQDSDRPANLCATVCPTGAIRTLTQPAKSQWKIGTATFDKNRCLPWARSEACLTCEEACPVPGKAIAHREEEVANPAYLALPEPERARPDAPLSTIHLARPYVLADRCIGCGTCENICPVDGPSGVRVGRLQEGATA